MSIVQSESRRQKVVHNMAKIETLTDREKEFLKYLLNVAYHIVSSQHGFNVVDEEYEKFSYDDLVRLAIKLGFDL